MRTSAIVVLVAANAALAQSVVVPNANEFAPGPSNQAFPWNQGNMRYQQVFARDQLGGLTGVVDAFAYRVDEGTGGAFGPVDIQAQIWLGYTDRNPGNLSETYDVNFVRGKTLVYDGTVSLSSAGGSDFDIVVDIDNTFSYDGTQNLLLEIKVFGNAFTTQFDAAGTGLGEGGTAWTDRLWAFDPNAATGNSAGDDGMVTQFTIGEGGCDDCDGDTVCDEDENDCNQDGEVDDCDESHCAADLAAPFGGVLNVFDFLAYQTAFGTGDSCADLAAPFGTLNVFDFLAYQTAFGNGC